MTRMSIGARQSMSARWQGDSARPGTCHRYPSPLSLLTKGGGQSSAPVVVCGTQTGWGAFLRGGAGVVGEGSREDPVDGIILRDCRRPDAQRRIRVLGARRRPLRRSGESTGGGGGSGGGRRKRCQRANKVAWTWQRPWRGANYTGDWWEKRPRIQQEGRGRGKQSDENRKELGRQQRANNIRQQQRGEGGWGRSGWKIFFLPHRRAYIAWWSR